MATVIFYEKPGCINNTKQKALLQAAGHEVEAHNLLTESWTRERLRHIFGDRPVVEWFNVTAPTIKSGQIQPDQLDAETALGLMLNDPLLIRRPILQVEDRCDVGFDISTVDRWIGLKAKDPTQQSTHNHLIHQDLQTCPNRSKQP